MYIDIILFAVIAAVLATNLYRILGKKTSNEKSFIKDSFSESQVTDSIFSDEVMDYSQKQIIELDRNFDFHEFLRGAKEAFKMIVVSYNNNTLNDVKDLISKNVYDNFNNTIDTTNKTNNSFHISSVKASIKEIEVIKKLAKIKVEFFSNQEISNENKIDNNKNVRDVWTFEKDMKAESPIWTLVEVGE